jgi:hypothetical protein
MLLVGFFFGNFKFLAELEVEEGCMQQQNQ